MMKPSSFSFSLRHSLTLRLFATIILPLTLLSVVIAIGSVVLHQREMRAHAIAGDWQAATDPVLELTLIAPLALIPPLVFAVTALWFANREIIQPLQRLERQAAALVWGDFDAIQQPVGGIAEVQRLQKELTEMARKVQTAQAGLRGYIGAITTAQEEERRRLARELHDDTIQAIIALKQRIQLTEQTVRDPAVQRMLNELEDLAAQTIENLRRMTRALRPIYLEDLGLVAALDMLARETGQNSGISIAFQKTGEERRLSPEVELALYRIAQEALNNVVRHSQARRADLRLYFGEKTVELEVSDDGIGFNVPQSPTDFVPNGHFGLLGMYERADLIGARLSVASAPGKGTRLKVRL
jgi:two-component system sensor histidine kinase UhpB